MPPHLRPLDSAEHYYALLDRIWPMNVLCAIELREAPTAEAVERAWGRISAAVPALGARITHEPGQAGFEFAAAGPEPVGTHADVATAFTAESERRFDTATGPLGRLMRIESAPVLVLAAHHAAFDGRAVAQLADLVAAVLSDGADPTSHPLAQPTESLGAHLPAIQARPDLALARTVRDEPAAATAADPIPWHSATLDSPRDVVFATVQLTADQTAALTGWSADNGATVQGALGAAVIGCLHDLAPEASRIGVTTPVDLRARATPPASGIIGSAAGLVSGSYEPSDPAELAAAFSGDVRRRVDRGEAELLFSLSGAHRLPPSDATDATFRKWTASAPPTVGLSNLGAVVSTEAVRGFTFALAPTPNQLAYVFAATTAGRLSVSVGVDRRRVGIEPDMIATALERHLARLAP